jgi:phosphatidylglycerophosphatase C
MSIVLYDFDRTLTNYDTIWSLGIAIANEKQHPIKSVYNFLKYFIKLKFRYISNNDFKKKCAALLLSNEEEKKILEVVEKYVNKRFHKMINVGILTTLQKYRNEGSHIYLVSSNYDFFLKQFIELWGLSGIIATQTEVINGIFTGRLLGEACHGVQKVLRVREKIGETRAREAIAYGDSRGDLELLKYVREGYWIKKGYKGTKKLRKINKITMEIIRSTGE